MDDSQDGPKDKAAPDNLDVLVLIEERSPILRIPLFFIELVVYRIHRLDNTSAKKEQKRLSHKSFLVHICTRN